MLGNVWLALVATLVIAVLWLRVCDLMAHKGLMSGPLSRKVIHIGTGPIFVLCWLLFPASPWARWLAALVPFAITVQFALIGLGVIKDQASVEAMSRTGDRREILRGPLFYGIVFVILTIVFWLDSPVGMIALMLLCGGDGLADVLGSRIKSAGLPWSKKKSWAGTLSMFLGGWLLTVGVLAVYVSMGVFDGTLLNYLPRVTLIALVCTLVESLPLPDVDNLTVPALAVMMGFFLFPF